MNLNLPKIQAVIAPLSAPIPSALGVAFEAYLYFANHVFLAWIAAIGAFVGIETLGGASCYALIKLHRERSYGVEFYIALLGIIVYVGSGVYTLAKSPLIIFFFLAPFSYFAYSIIRSMEKEIEDKTIETEAQIALINAETKRINAETRKSKAASQPVQSVQLDTGHTTLTNGQCRADVANLLDTESNLSGREIARRLRISHQTANTHKRMWEIARLANVQDYAVSRALNGRGK